MPNPLKHMRGIKLLIKVGDGGSPENFDQQCSVNAERGVTFTSGTNDQDVIDCDDAEALAWIVREKTNLSVAINGGGTLNTPDVPFFFEKLISPDPANCKVIVDVPSIEGGVIFTGAFHLTEFGLTGNRGEKAQASTSWVSDGAVTMDPNTP